MMSGKRTYSFTLMETMVAATILSLSVAAVLGILGGARSSLIRARERWNWQHQLSQATEIFLLGGPEAEFPDGLLQEGCTAYCELYEVEDVHEEALEHVKEWLLAEYYISVQDRDGRVRGENWVQKLVKEEDLE